VPALILPIIFVALFWVVIIRPQQQRQREHRAMIEQLAPGDRIEGFSGIHGTLVEVDDTTVRVEIAEGVVVTMAKLAVAGTIDAEDRVQPAPDTGADPAHQQEDPA
jgi:preprotein translocase subunit YajC